MHARKDPKDLVRWTADTVGFPLGDAASYQWAAVDPRLAAIAASGAKAYVRVGESWNGTNQISGPAQRHYAEVARELVQHIAAAVPIDRFEIWNEPEVNGRFWQLTATDFYSLYGWLVRTATAPTGKRTGGAGFTFGAAYDWRDPIVTRWATDADPAGDDFFSAHFYGDCDTATPEELVAWLDTVRANMLWAGLRDHALHVTEWNMGDVGKDKCSRLGTAAHGSYVAAALLLMSQPDFHVRRSHYYSGISRGAPGLFWPDGDYIRMNPAAWGLWGYRALAERTRVGTNQSWGTGSGSPADAARAGQRWFGQFARDPATGREFAEIVNDQSSTLDILVKVKGSPATASLRQKSGLATTGIWAGSGPTHIVGAADAEAALTVPEVIVRWTPWLSESWMALRLPPHSITTLEW